MLAAASIYGKHITSPARRDGDDRLPARTRADCLHWLVFLAESILNHNQLQGGRFCLPIWLPCPLSPLPSGRPLLKYNPVGKVTVFNFLVPNFGTLLSGIILDESIWRLNYLIALVLVSLVSGSSIAREGEGSILHVTYRV
jgi:hypothetical protein